MIATLAEGMFVGALVMFWVVCNMLIVDIVRDNHQSWGEYIEDSQNSMIGKMLMTTFYCIAAVITF